MFYQFYFVFSIFLETFYNFFFQFFNKLTYNPLKKHKLKRRSCGIYVNNCDQVLYWSKKESIKIRHSGNWKVTKRKPNVIALPFSHLSFTWKNDKFILYTYLKCLFIKNKYDLKAIKMLKIEITHFKFFLRWHK